MSLTNHVMEILVLTLNLLNEKKQTNKKQLTTAVKTFAFLSINSPLPMWINVIRLLTWKGTINIQLQVLNVVALYFSLLRHVVDYILLIFDPFSVLRFNKITKKFPLLCIYLHGFIKKGMK